MSVKLVYSWDMFSSVNVLFFSFLLLEEFVKICFSKNVTYGEMIGDEYNSECVIKMRGLPWSATAEDIVKFFNGCNIKNGTLGVHIVINKEGRPSGEAFVQMNSEGDMDLACLKDQEYLGHRYIEVSRALKSEMLKAVRRSKLSIQRTMNDGCVRLRGLPFKCKEEEIFHFFEGLEIVPQGITFVIDDTGKPTGEAYVIFKTKEMADKALQQHKEKIYHRYIEVFRSSLGEVRLARLSQKRAFQSRGPPFYNELTPPEIMYDVGHNTPYYRDFNQRAWEGNRQFHWKTPWTRRRMADGRTNFGAQNNEMNPFGKSHSKRHIIHMRGLPFRATHEDIQLFFSPIKTVHIRVICDINGRPNGEADVEFETKEDLLKSMSKDNSVMQHRYIELSYK